MCDREQSSQTVSPLTLTAVQTCAALGLALWGLAATYTLLLPFIGTVNFSAPNYYVTVSLVIAGITVNRQLLKQSKYVADYRAVLAATSVLLSMFLVGIVVYARYRASG